MNRNNLHLPQDINALEVINGSLGSGFSSKVSLVEYKINKQKFALKTVKINRLILKK